MDLTLAGLPWAAVAGFAITSALIEITPGPNLVYLALVAATDGRRPGFAAVAGVALGLGILGVLAALGLAALIDRSPVVYAVLRWGGVAYLLWLAWDGWREAGDTADLAALGSSLSRYFGRGLITNLLNPKAALYYVSVLPGFLTGGPQVLEQTLWLSGIYVIVATAIHVTIVALAGTAQIPLQDQTRSRMVRRILALALALVALWFACKTRT